MSSVHCRHEPFEGEPQTRGDQIQAERPYRIHYKHPSTNLPAVLGVNEEEARGLLAELQKLFPAVAGGKAPPKKKAASKKPAAKKGAEKKESGNGAPDATKDPSKSEAASVEEGEAVAVAIDDLLGKLKQADQEADDWETTEAFGDGNNVHLKFPDGSSLNVVLTDVEGGVWTVHGIRLKGEEETPFTEEGLNAEGIVALVKKIAPVMQGKEEPAES